MGFELNRDKKNAALTYVRLYVRTKKSPTEDLNLRWGGYRLDESSRMRRAMSGCSDEVHVERGELAPVWISPHRYVNVVVS